MHQFQLWLTFERHEQNDSGAMLPAPQRQLCRDAMAAATPQPSLLQADVGGVLAGIRPGFEEEYVEPQTGYSLDLALPSSRLAIEVDGPSHFLLRDARGEH